MKGRKKEERLAWVESDGEKRLATLSLAPGVRVYDEKLVSQEGREYRVWNPFRSKAAAALIKGLKEFPISEGMAVLYLGVSTGTTASHISDLIGEGGVLFGVEMSPRVARDFVERVAQHRRNVIPIIADARMPERYPCIYGQVDLLYCDIAQPDQTEIALENCRRFLKDRGILLLIVKARSIDVTRKPSEIFSEEAEKLKRGSFSIRQVIRLEPFDLDHAMIYARQEKGGG